MANNNEDLIAAVGLDLDSWDRGLRQIQADERKVERALDSVVDAANDAEKAINSIDGSINLDVDTGDLDKAKNIVEALDGMDPSFDIDIDESELDSVRRLIEDIDGDAPTVDVIVDEDELDAAKRKVEDIDGDAPNVDVDVDDTEVTDVLQQIRDMQAIEVVMTVSGNVLDVIHQLADIGVGGIIEMDDAMAHFEATTGRSSDFLEGLVDNLHGQGITASIEEIGTVAEQAMQLGIHFQQVDDAAVATFNTISVTGGDSVETLRRINQMVDLGLADSFQEASDIIVSGFQTGADRGGDFLDVIDEYGSTFQRLGFDGTDALNLINSGLEAGFGNADRVADAVREMDIRTRAAADAFSAMEEIPEPNTAAWDEWYNTLDDTSKALADLDLTEETMAFANGELSGEDYFNTVLEQINEIDDAAARASATVAIFGTQAEDIGTEAVLGLSTEGLAVEDIEGTAQEAADVMTDTMSGAIAEVQLMIDDLARAFFSSDQLDIDGKLDDAKRRIQAFIDAINSGATFGEGLEIALEMPGLEDQIRDLEGILGNFLLGFMEGIAGILDAVGQGGAASDLRETIRDMADDQLAFDIQVADDGVAVSESIQRAISRGVDPALIQESVDTAFNEAMASGDLGAAQLIVDSIDPNVLAAGMSEPIRAALIAGTMGWGDVQTLADELQITYDEALAMVQSGEAQSLALAASMELDTTGFQEEIDAAAIEARDAFEQTAWSGDVTGAAQMAEQMGSSLVDEFSRLVSEGNFDLAAILAAGSPESGLDISYAADQAGYSDEAIATMEANAQLVVDAANETADATLLAADTTETNLDGTAEVVETYAAETGEALGTAGGEFVGFANTVDGEIARVNTAIDTAITSMGELTDAAAGLDEIDVSVDGGTDANGSAPGHALGGVDSGTFITGEAGRELVTTDTAMAILNNQTTESILSGLAALFSGGFGAMSGGSTITINQTNTFNNSGAAASNASLDNAAKGIRGF